MPSLPVADTHLHVTTAGSGPPLLFVHGFPLDHTMWRSQIDHFARSHAVIAPDLRGFGQSAVSPGRVTMSRFADDLADLLNELGIQQPVCICGLSMGGYIAFEFFRRHRSRIGSLVLCDTRAAADAPNARETRQETAERVLQEGTGFLADAMIEKLLAAATRRQDTKLVAFIQEMIRSAPAVGTAAAALGMADRNDSTELLEQIDVPTLVIVGAEDAITPAEEMRVMAGKIPQAQFVLLEEAGHLAPLEQPDKMNAELEQFLQRVSSQAVRA